MNHGGPFCQTVGSERNTFKVCWDQNELVIMWNVHHKSNLLDSFSSSLHLKLFLISHASSCLDQTASGHLVRLHCYPIHVKTRSQTMKTLINILVPVLANQLNLTLLNVLVPSDWSTAIINPIFKKWGRIDAGSAIASHIYIAFRPSFISISILRYFRKLTIFLKLAWNIN